MPTDFIEMIKGSGGSLSGTFAGLPDQSIAAPNVLGSGIDYRIFYGSFPGFSSSVVLSPVPEPLHLLLVGGLAGIAFRRIRRGAKSCPNLNSGPPPDFS